LIDVYYIFQLPGAQHIVDLQRLRQIGRIAVPVQLADERRVQCLIHERALSRAADARHEA
jgi:hypothetical protein